MGSFDYDVLVVGSGFGGSVTALRLTEKGYRVGVVEAGRRFTDDTVPETNWDLRAFFWAPKLGMKGMQRVTLLRNVLVLSGAGVGGGSLVYANTLYEPPDTFYSDRQWGHITDWHAELAPFYDNARRMLGVVRNPHVTAADVAMKAVADEIGVGHTFELAPVGVYFGDPARTVADPYFGGVGPPRTGCIECGNCMVGCRHNAKNRLDKNYLYLAERNGCVVHPETTVTAVRPLPGGGYAVDTTRTGTWRRRHRRSLRAEQVVLAAGALGTQRLLHRMRDTGVLPRLSPRLGELTRTNSEALLGAVSRHGGVDFSQGVAITSSIYPDRDTHIQPVRYGKRNNAMKLLATAMTDGGPGGPRWWKWLCSSIADPDQLRILFTHHWSERTIIVLVMQSLDNSLTIFGKRGLLGRHKITSRQGHGAPNPDWIPVGNEVTRRLASRIDGVPGGGWNELVNIPMTAHFIGGCPIGDSARTGVIDPWHRAYGHEGLHVVDGAALSANLGVNPSLTITAQAERAMAFWPNKGEADPRPPLGSPYRVLPPTFPRHPAVPAHAPAALRFAPAGPPGPPQPPRQPEPHDGASRTTV